MQTSNDLLKSILLVVGRIDQRMARDSSSSKGGTGSITGKIKNIGKTKSNDQGSAVAASLPLIIKEMKNLGKINDKKALRGINVLDTLFTSFSKLGEPRRARNVNNAIRLLNTMGRSLMKVARPLRMMSNFLLKLGLGIIGFAGSIFAAAKILKLTGNPMKVIGIVALIVTGMVGALTLLGLAGPFVKRGTRVATGMGVAMMSIALGIFSFALSLVATSAILGAGPGLGGVVKSLGVMTLIIGGTALMFSILGKFATPIVLGTAIAAGMAGGMAVLALGIFAFALAAKSVSILDAAGNTDDVTQGDADKSSIVGGLGTMGVIILGATAMFSLLGIPVVAGLISTGVGVSLLMSGGLIALAYSTRSLSKISKELAGENISDNVSNLVSGVFIGFTRGVSEGLTGTKSDDATFWQKTGGYAKNIAKVMTGIGLVSGVAISLSLFAMSLKAFQSLGSISPIIGGTQKDPQYGPPVSVIDVSRNIAYSISTFFTTLNELFQEGGGMPTQENMETMTNVLMGTGGLRLFGFDVARTKPNMMDALMKFGEILKFWGQFGAEGKIPLGTGPDGLPLEGVPLTSVAHNIATAVGGFMRSLSTEIPAIGEELQPQIAQMAIILLGKKANFFGKLFGLSSDVIGILEPVSKFAEVIKQFAMGQIVTGYDENSNPIYEQIDYAKTAKNIVSAISGFTVELAKGLSTLSSKGDFASNAEGAADYIGQFDSMFNKLEHLSNATSGLDKLSASLTNVGSGIGVIADNLDRMDSEKLGSTVNAVANYEKQTANLPAKTMTASAKAKAAQGVDWDNVSAMIGSQVGLEVSNALKKGQFRFEFDTTKAGGVYYWDPS